MKKLILIFLLAPISLLMATDKWLDYYPLKIIKGQGGAFYIEPKTKFKIYVYGSPEKYIPQGIIIHKGSLLDAFRSNNGILRDFIRTAKQHHSNALIIIDKNKPMVFAVAGFWPAFAFPVGGGSLMVLAIQDFSTGTKHHLAN
ncbi:hypothetical protein A946_04010 [Methylacidiphilum kamchatkense Kam1]|uniref:Uncharacterized protein n=1 Tax=Methylacidiphilum kamchatkense Kam1 TaxID=1202785 RepID=A0ABR4ZX21_9BACT|nr:hypothetical protein [Methylacidiphilum kamchatkense]KIE58624.1 hypothetical protein A946_04010 [Methylacidiphilum kamchatkense Kam1]